MSSIVISGDTSGSITLSAPSVAGTNTATLPAATGTVMVSGNQPAFYATMSATQSIANGTFTKVAFNTKIFDTANVYDTTNYRFLPLVAGYYQCNFVFPTANSATGQTNMAFYKTGSAYGANSASNTVNTYTNCLSTLVYLNGSTDYLEAYIYQSSGTSQTMGSTSGVYCYFQAVLVRTA